MNISKDKILKWFLIIWSILYLIVLYEVVTEHVGRVFQEGMDNTWKMYEQGLFHNFSFSNMWDYYETSEPYFKSVAFRNILFIMLNLIFIVPIIVVYHLRKRLKN